MLIISFKITEIDKIFDVQALGEGIEIQIEDLHSINLWKLAQVRKGIHKPLFLSLPYFETSPLDEKTRYALLKSLCALHPDSIRIHATGPELEELKEAYPTISWISSLEKENTVYKTFAELQTSH